MSSKDVIILGDIHGTIVEFNQLLDKINYDQKTQRVILVGDLVDRGDDPLGCIRLARKLNLECVLGNHESKMLRWRKHELRKHLTGQDNPMQSVNEKRKEEWESFSQEDLDWMYSLPLTIDCGNGWNILHGGLEPKSSFQEQDPEKIIRARYIDKNGKAKALKPDKSMPEETKFWATVWNGKESVIFGHSVFQEPTFFVNENNICVGIDTGCVYGNKLTAYNLTKNKFTFVKAEKAYYKK